MFQKGDLLLLKPGHYVPKGGRYSQGIVIGETWVDPHIDKRVVPILWFDCNIQNEYVSNISPHYTVISVSER